MRKGDSLQRLSEIDSRVRAADLDQRALRVFRFLAEHPNNVLGKYAIMENAWAGRTVEDTSLHQAIRRLRRAVGDDGTVIETVHGQGYRLNVAASDAATRGAIRSAGHDWLATKKGAMVALSAIIALTLFSVGTLFLGSRLRGEAEHAHTSDPAMALLSDEILAKADPYAGKSYNPELRKIVADIAPTIDFRFAKQPELQLQLHQRIGDIFDSAGEYGKADDHLHRALELAEQLGKGRKTKIWLLVQMCETERMGNRLEAAAAHCQRAISVANEYPVIDDRPARIARGKLIFETGDYRTAYGALKAIVASRDFSNLDPGSKADALWFLGLASRQLRLYAESRENFEKLVKIRRANWGDLSPYTAWALSDYGKLLLDTDNLEDAERALQEAKAIFTKTLGPDHVETLTPDSGLAILKIRKGDFAESEKILSNVLNKYEEFLGKGHFWIIYAESYLALSYAKDRDSERSRRMIEIARRDSAPSLYGKPQKAAHFYTLWSDVYYELGDKASSKKLLLAAAQNLKVAGFTNGDPWLAEIQRKLIRVKTSASIS